MKFLNKMCILATGLAVSTGLVSAQTPLQMAFVTDDGIVSTIDVQSLSMTVNGGKLTAANSTRSLTFDLQKLTRMYFTDQISGVEFAAFDITCGPVNAYNLDGKYLGEYETCAKATSSLTPGTYIIVTPDNKSLKITVQ